MQCHHTASPKDRTVPSVSKVMGTVICDAEEIMLDAFMLIGETIKVVHWIQTLKTATCTL
jgi:hypothetical protein